jgi:hypothetical protein
MNLDAYVTRSQAALLTGVRPDTIGKWHARGWSAPDGEHHTLRTQPGKGRVLLFRLGDILTAERDTRLNPRARRRNLPPALVA